MDLTSLITALCALTLGFLAGLLTFKRSLRWCRNCGTVLKCPVCTTGKLVAVKNLTTPSPLSR